MIDHEHDAANVLQEAWLAAFRGISNLKQDARLAPWLYTIVRRAALNHYRGHYGRDEQPTADAALLDYASEQDEQLNFDHAELVHFGLSKLPQREREALTLYFLDDLSITEIAAVLEIPGGTVKSRLSHARAALRQILDREENRHER